MPKMFSTFFSFKGRSGRASYWSLTGLYALAFVAGIAALTASGIVMHAGPDDASTLAVVPIFVAFMAAIWVALAAVGVRRLHDRGRTGYWLMLYYGLPLWASKGARYDAAGVIQLAVALGMVIWTVIDLGVLPGDPGSNGFGLSLRTTALFKWPHCSASAARVE